jgi:hypothetical protein
MADLQMIVEEISKLSLLEASELVKMLEKKLGVSAAAPVAVAAVPMAGTAAAVEEEHRDGGRVQGSSRGRQGEARGRWGSSRAQVDRDHPKRTSGADQGVLGCRSSPAPLPTWGADSRQPIPPTGRC